MLIVHGVFSLYRNVHVSNNTYSARARAVYDSIFTDMSICIEDFPDENAVVQHQNHAKFSIYSDQT